MHGRWYYFLQFSIRKLNKDTNNNYSIPEHKDEFIEINVKIRWTNDGMLVLLYSTI